MRRTNLAVVLEEELDPRLEPGTRWRGDADHTVLITRVQKSLIWFIVSFDSTPTEWKLLPEEFLRMYPERITP